MVVAFNILKGAKVDIIEVGKEVRLLINLLIQSVGLMLLAPFLDEQFFSGVATCAASQLCRPSSTFFLPNFSCNFLYKISFAFQYAEEEERRQGKIRWRRWCGQGRWWSIEGTIWLGCTVKFEADRGTA